MKVAKNDNAELAAGELAELIVLLPVELKLKRCLHCNFINTLSKALEFP